MSRVLVTGANGFIGQRLCEEMLLQGWLVRAAVRSPCQLPAHTEMVLVSSMVGETNWANALRDVDVVIHLAARVHVMKDTAADPLTEFLKVNMQGTANLAYQAAAAGVRRLVYVSSVKVNGEYTTKSQPFTEADEHNPQDAYATSKWRAEQALPRIARESGLEFVIVRPPLVYGPGVKGNFIRLLKAVDKGMPLPLASVRNKRSLIYLGNLVDALILCAVHPDAAGKTYLVSDGEDISTPDLIRQMAFNLGRSARLFPLPAGILRGLGRLLGKREPVERMVGSLRVDDSLVRKELGWEPGYTLQQGLEKTACWYKEQAHSSGTHCLPKRPAGNGADGNVSVVIVNYNAGAKLLESVAAAQHQVGQIIVVDNASTDGSIACLKNAFTTVGVICNEKNLGFAKACNLGAQAAEGDYIFFLNPDCILEPDAVSFLLGAVNSAPGVSMVGGLLINPDGTEQAGGRRAVPTPRRSFVRAFGLSRLGHRYPRLFSDFVLHKQPLPNHTIEVEAISGACMLVRRDAMYEVGLLDENYFMHCEDLDWCMRFRQKGWKILFVPEARMIHHKGHCSKSRPIFIEWNKHKGMIRFYRKFFRHQYPGVLMGMVVVGVWMRFATVAVYYAAQRLLRKPDES